MLAWQREREDLLERIARLSQDLAAALGRGPVKTPREARRDGHARWLAKRRELLAFIRSCTEPGKEPQFREIARLTRAKGLTAKGDRQGKTANYLLRIWQKRTYLDSPKAEDELWMSSAHSKLSSRT